MVMSTVVSIAEPSRNALKKRLSQAMAQTTCEDIEPQLSALERILASQITDQTLDARDLVVHDAGVRMFHYCLCVCLSRGRQSSQGHNLGPGHHSGDSLRNILEDLILDTRAYAEFCLRIGGFRHYQPSGHAASPVIDEFASPWLIGQFKIHDEPQTISLVSRRLPGNPATYRLEDTSRDALVLRISARKQWRQTLVRVWVGELERFLAMKAFMNDTDASKLSPSGKHSTNSTRAPSLVDLVVIRSCADAPAPRYSQIYCTTHQTTRHSVVPPFGQHCNESACRLRRRNVARADPCATLLAYCSCTCTEFQALQLWSRYTPASVSSEEHCR